ncbi:MAG TPA: PA14 domain-containing protein [Planctomycetota bacterium]|nr:PA14 domain-containing protein [Planctomycetota bacterium]
MNATAALVVGACAASELPIPELARWEANMVTYGRRHAASLAAGKHTMPPLAEAGTSVYYDGALVFQNIAAYTGDASWYTAADDATYVYRDRAIRPNDCAVTPYWNFTDGMRLHWQRTGDAISRDTVLTMSQRSFMTDWTSISVMWGYESSRETAYVIEGLMNARKVGGPERSRLHAAVDCALGHIDQWFVSRSAPSARVFMVGLTCRALIEYHAMTGDPRILPAVRTAMEACWNEAWRADSESFAYDTGGAAIGAELNLMVAPAMAWLYVRTGETVWRDRGDAAFAGCAKYGWIDGMKQFNQVYRWSFDYVKWRQAGPATPPPTPNQAPIARIGASATTGVAPAAISFSAAGSSDADGVIAAYAWDFGNGMGGSGVTASTTYAAAGSYTVRLTVRDDDGATATAATLVTVTAPVADPGVIGSGTGLRGEYFDNADFTGATTARVDRVVDFDWGGGAPDAALGVDTFSARWTGTVLAPRSERLTFHVVGDDGVRLWVGGQLIVDAWIDQGPTEWTGALDVVRGQAYDIRLEYYENGGGAVARLLWSSPTMARAVVPTSQLTPAGPTVTPPPAPAGNLIVNASFEAGAASWVDRGNSAVITGSAVDGAAALRVGTGAGGRSQAIAGVRAGATYRLDGWARVGAKRERGSIGVEVVDAAGVTRTYQVEFTGRTYAEKSLTFTTPEGCRGVTVRVWKAAGSSYLYVDALELVEVDAAPSGAG